MTVLAEDTRAAVQLRVSDHERESRADLLRQHAGAGRLTAEELEERLDLAYAARTQDELAGLLEDLPAIGATVADRPPRQRCSREELTAFVVVNVVLIGIWAATGAGYFWPIWPLLGWGLGLVSHARGGGCRALTGRRREYAS